MEDKHYDPRFTDKETKTSSEKSNDLHEVIELVVNGIQVQVYLGNTALSYGEKWWLQQNFDMEKFPKWS